MASKINVHYTDIIAWYGGDGPKEKPKLKAWRFLLPPSIFMLVPISVLAIEIWSYEDDLKLIEWGLMDPPAKFDPTLTIVLGSIAVILFMVCLIIYLRYRGAFKNGLNTTVAIAYDRDYDELVVLKTFNAYRFKSEQFYRCMIPAYKDKYGNPVTVMRLNLEFKVGNHIKRLKLRRVGGDLVNIAMYLNNRRFREQYVWNNNEYYHY